MSQLTIRTITMLGVVGLLGLFAAGCGQKADEEVVDDEVVDAEVADGVVVDGELVDGEVTERGRLRDRIVAAAPPRVADRIEDREEIRENRRETFKDCGISISDECQAERQGNREEARKTRRENRRAVIAGLSPMESDMIHEFREMAIAARPCLDGIPGGMFSEFTSDPTLFFQSRMKFDADSFEFDDIDLQTTSALTILNQALPEGPAKCILGVADEKFSGQMVEARNNLIAEFTDFAEQMRDKAREKVAAVIADKLKDALTSDTSTDLLTPEELKAVANDVLVNLLIAKLNNASNHLSTLTDNLGSGGTGESGPLGAIDSARVDMRFESGSDSRRELQRDFAWGIIRAMGHKYIDNDETGRGGYLVNKAVGKIHLADGTIEKGASAACGLLPFAGAAACAVVEEGVDIVWNQVVIPRIQSEISGALHDVFDAAVNAARLNNNAAGNFEFLNGLVEDGSDFMDGALIDSLTEEHLTTILSTLESYNDNVYALGQEAADRI